MWSFLWSVNSAIVIINMLWHHPPEPFSYYNEHVTETPRPGSRRTYTVQGGTGSLNASRVDAQAKLLASQGIKLAFITGSTGESSSMQLEERKEIYSAWKEASARHGVQVIAHTGSNSVWDARELAAFAQECGFVATSSLAPSYYKPATVQRLVECCAFAASGAPDLPYYYYDIPVLTGVRFNPG